MVKNFFLLRHSSCPYHCLTDHGKNNCQCNTSFQNQGVNALMADYLVQSNKTSLIGWWRFIILFAMYLIEQLVFVLEKRIGMNTDVRPRIS